MQKTLAFAPGNVVEFRDEDWLTPAADQAGRKFGMDHLDRPNHFIQDLAGPKGPEEASLGLV